MNPLLLINSFYKHLLTHPISGQAAALYFGIYHIGNSAGWPSKFKARNMDLCACGCCSSESVFFKARKELEDNGYITYTPAGGQGIGIYSLIALYENNFANNATKNDSPAKAIEPAPAPAFEPQTDEQKQDVCEQTDFDITPPEIISFEIEDENNDFKRLNEDEMKSNGSLTAVKPQSNGSLTAVKPQRNKDIYINKIYKQEFDVNTSRICARDSRYESLLIEYRVNKSFFINDEVVEYVYKDLTLFKKFTESFLSQLESKRPLTIKGETYSHKALCYYAKEATDEDFNIIFQELYLPRKDNSAPIISKPITDYTKFIYQSLINRIKHREKKIYPYTSGFTIVQ